MTDMSNEKSKDEIRKKFQKMDMEINMAAPDRRLPRKTIIDFERITLDTKNDIRKFRKKL